MMLTEEKSQNRVKQLRKDQEQVKQCLKLSQDDYTKQLLQQTLQALTQEHLIEETEANIRAIKYCQQDTEDEAKKRDYQGRIHYMQDQLYELKKHRAGHVAEIGARIRAQLAHQDQLAFLQQQADKRPEEPPKRILFPHVPRKKRNPKKWKRLIDYRKTVSSLEMEQRGCIFFTKDRREYIHLYNDLLVDPVTMNVKPFREVLAVTQHIRNSEGEMLYKYSKQAFRPIYYKKI
ncbi:hypothetical protein ACRW9N_10750 [Listeria aquatica]|uniref:hypothetical protein n=1 Tax=Listeria aquatica TaxID=1494960 RepID=UPI003EFAF488